MLLEWVAVSPLARGRIRLRSRAHRQLAFVAALASAAPGALAQLRVVTLNGANTLNSNDGAITPRNPWMSNILSAIGTTVSDDPYITGNTGIAKPIDVLCLQECDGYATTGAAYASLLNSLYPTANYKVAQINGGYTDPNSSTQCLVYNDNVVNLIAKKTVGAASGSGQPRQALRYQLQPVGYDSSASFYIYNSHYKAASDSTSQGRRNTEAQAIRTDADALGAGANIIYLGDFNVYTNTEPMWQTLTAGGSGQAFDPINKVGTWDNSSTYKAAHTQSPYNSTTATNLGTGFTGTGGGMDDRFDFQLVSANMNDAHGLAYITNSYQAFGNNGTHSLNGSINGASNTFQPHAVLDSLAGILDHLPVVADYQLPAKLSVSVAAAPAQVIVGASVSINATVSNAAPVSFANGAEVMNYQVLAGGALTGAFVSTDAALGGGNSHPIGLSTGSAGAKSGSISVTSSNQQVAGNNFSQTINYSVLDHAQPSFMSGSNVTTATADFGYVPIGSAPRSIGVSVFNRVATAGYTAGLDVDSVTNSGDTARLTTSATILSNLAAASNVDFDAQLDSSVAGNFSATHTLATSDQNLPGATSLSNLMLTSTARVFSVADFPVTGYMFLPTNEPLTVGGPWSIHAGVTLTKTGPGTITISGTQTNGPGSQLIMNGGGMTMNSDAGPLAITLNAGTSATFNASQHVASLVLNGGGSANIGPNGGRTLVTGAVSIAGGSKLDLRDNNLIVHTASVGTWNGAAYRGVTGLIATAFNGGAWNGASGIFTSESSAIDPNTLTSIGVASASDLGLAGGVWNGETIAGGDVLVMFTYAGDANLDGIITGDDYFQIDSAFPANLSGWFNGDVNYDGIVNGDD
jgi:endonuclease/exonuclease/phosphatase family metal-dependent hydrolase